MQNLLKSRGVQNPIICPMCETDVEHLRHIFLEYNFAKECWRLMCLSFDLSTVEVVPDWVIESLATETKEVKVQIATVMWGIWGIRILRSGSKKC